MQPLQALGISIIALVPYNILETLNNNNILADFAVCQKIVSLPLTLYINAIFVRFRNSIIKSLHKEDYWINPRNTTKQIYM